MHLFGATVSVCLAHLASPCLALPSQQEGEPRVVRLLLQRQNIETHAAYDGQRLAKRNGTIQKDLDNLVCSLIANPIFNSNSLAHRRLSTSSTHLSVLQDNMCDCIWTRVAAIFG